MRNNPYESTSQQSARSSFSDYSPVVAELANADVRANFLKNTYLHLLGALIAFASICGIIINVFHQQLEPIVRTLTGGYTWLLFLGGFMFISYIADRWANSNTSRQMQYLGLAVYVIAESLFFVPLLYIAQKFIGPDVIWSAGIMTAIVFGGLSLTVLITRADFSFLRSALAVAGFAALGLIACSILLGMSLGIWFSVAMIVFASVAILYNTSNILHHYNPQQHVAASLALFASVTLLFWYVIQLFMSMRE
jgi:FtsH-binding integral membrane protein